MRTVLWRLRNHPGSGWLRISSAGACLFALVAPTGCHFLHKSTDSETTQACDPYSIQTNQMPRRIYVKANSPFGMAVGGPQQEFVTEVVAALNSIPNCNAILLAPHISLEPVAGTLGPPAELLMMPDIQDPQPAIEEILLIEVLEVQPYRPMRLSAVIERRNYADGSVISRRHHTWNARRDDEPLSPSKFNRFVLNHPSPLADVEAIELARLSPQSFYRNVASQVAIELIDTPFGIAAVPAY